MNRNNLYKKAVKWLDWNVMKRTIATTLIFALLGTQMPLSFAAGLGNSETGTSGYQTGSNAASSIRDSSGDGDIDEEEGTIISGTITFMDDGSAGRPFFDDLDLQLYINGMPATGSNIVVKLDKSGVITATGANAEIPLENDLGLADTDNSGRRNGEEGFLTWSWYVEGLPENDSAGTPYTYSIRDMRYHPATVSNADLIDGYGLFYTDESGAVVDTGGRWSIDARNLVYVQKGMIQGSFFSEDGAEPLSLIPSPAADEDIDYITDVYGWIEMGAGSWYITDALMFNPATGEEIIWRGQVDAADVGERQIRYDNIEEYGSFDDYIYEGGTIFNYSTACQVTGIILWMDSGDELGKRPAAEDFALQVTDVDGAPVPGVVIEIEEGIIPGIWNYTIRGLSVNGTYKVKAAVPDGYIEAEEEIAFTAAADMVVDTPIVMQVSTPGAVTIKAEVEGLAGPEEVALTYTLMADGEEYTGRYTIHYEDGTAVTGTGPQILVMAGETVVVQLTDTVEETEVAVRPVLSGDSGVLYITHSYEAEDNSYVFRYSALTSVEACVVWNDNNNYDGERPYPDKESYLAAELLELYFSLDGGATYQSVKDYYGDLGLTHSPGFSILPSAEGSDWYYIVDGLPVYGYVDGEWIKIQYQVRVADEAKEPGYIISESEYITTTDREYWQISYTKELVFHATVQWYDDEENNQVRPGMDSWKDTLTVYQIGKDGIPVPVEGAGVISDIAVEQDPDDSSKWNLTISGLPEYDEDGHPYVYYVVPAEVSPDDDNTLLNQGEELSYATEYDNTGNFTIKEDGCYQGGIIVNVLQGKTDFLMTKEWTDGDSGSRPDVTLVLWRYVKGEDYLAAAKVDLEPEPAIDSTQSPYQVEISDLPLFDEDGHEYIYFIKEEMKNPGDYIQEITNVDPYYKESGADQLVFHEGTLNNKLSRTETISGNKTWKAKSVQGMKATVTVELQRREAGSTEPWKTVEVQEVSGFRTEVMTQEFTFEEEAKYSEAGVQYEYRVVETGGSITYPGGSPVSFVIPEAGYDIDPYRYTAGEYEFERTTDPDGTIINTLVGETAIEIDKYWNPYDGMTSQLHFHIFRNDEDDCICEELAGVSGAELEADGQGGHLGVLVMTPEDAVAAGDNSHWNHYFAGLPKYDDEGAEYSYKISEDIPDNYSNHLEMHYGTSGASNDKHLIAEVSNNKGPGDSWLKVTKTWLDDSDLLHREDVTVALYKDGTATGGTLTLSADNVWLGYFKLPSGADYTEYTVKEINIGAAGRQNPDGTHEFPYFETGKHIYEVVEEDYIGDAEWRITNRRVGLIDIDLTKSWAAGGAEAGYSAEFTLNRNGVPFGGTVVLDASAWDSAAGVFHGGFGNLPKYDENGKLYEYTLIETKANGETVNNNHFTYGGITYQTSLKLTAVDWADEHDGNDTYYWAAVNKRTGTSDLVFHKIWKDDLGAEKASRPGIYLKLYRWTDKNADGVPDGDEESSIVSVEKLANWEWDDDCHQIITFRNLQKYDDQGYPYAWYAEEGVHAPNHGGWEKVYFDDRPAAEGEYQGDYSKLIPLEKENGKTVMPENGIVVNYRTGETFVSGRKIWENMGVLNTEDYPEIEISLYASFWDPDQGAHGSPQPVEDENGNPVTAMIKVENGSYVSTYSFTELPKYDPVTGVKILYTASEELQTDPEAVKNFQMLGTDFGFKNTYEPNKDLSIKVTKEWDWGSLGGQPDHFIGYPSVTFVLYRVIQKWDEDRSEYVDAGYSPVEVKRETLTGTMSDSGQTSVEFADLSYHAPNGRPYRYYVKETGPGGYTSSTSGSGTDVGIAELPEGGYTGTCTVTNTFTAQTVNIEGTKTWSGDNGWNTRPDIDPGITLTLWRKYGSQSWEAGEKVEAELVWSQGNPGNEWTYEFKETTQPFYRYTTTGYEYTYYVREDAVPGYETPAGYYTGAKDTVEGLIVYTVNMTNKLDTTALDVIKIWNDSSNQYGTRPGDITVKLQRKAEGALDFEDVMNPADQTSVWTKILTGSSTTNAGWNAAFTGLPKYDLLGNEYEYRAIEAEFTLTPEYGGGTVLPDSQDGLSGTIGGYTFESKYMESEGIGADTATGSNARITNTLLRRKVTVEKIWEDADNQDGARPTGVTVELRYDGKSYVPEEKVELSAANGWKYEWKNLPAQHADGTPFEYSVTEIAMKGLDETQWGTDNGYETSNSDISASEDQPLTVTNSRTPETMEYTVYKFWDDSSEYDWSAERPDSIQVQLYRQVSQGAPAAVENGLVTLYAEAREGHDAWTYTWTGLPKYARVGGVETGAGTSFEVQYSVKEVIPADGSGYVAVIDGNQITNQLKTTQLAVTKEWEDQNNYYGLRPQTITIQLQRSVNGTSWQDVAGVSQELDVHDSTQTCTFIGLPIRDKDNNPWQYRAVETYMDEVNVISHAASGYKVTYEHEPNHENAAGVSEPGETVITNTMKTGALAVTKIQEGGYSTDFTFRVKLNINGRETLYTGAYTVLESGAAWNESGEVRQPDESGAIVIRRDQQFVITGLPASVAYVVTEASKNQFTLVSTVADTGVIPYQDAATASFTNKYTSGGGGGGGGGTTPAQPGTETPTGPPTESTAPTTPDLPPVAPDHNLVPNGDGSYYEVDDNGVVLGKWYQDEDGTWIFDDEVPLADLARTGDNALPYAMLTFIMLGAIGTMTALVVKRRKEDNE